MKNLSASDIEQAVRTAGLADQPLCVHSSLRSFGYVEGGALTVINGLLDAGCTVLVPTFTYDFAISPPPGPAMRPARNGCDYEYFSVHRPRITAQVYTPEVTEVERGMGAIPAALAAQRQRVRGNHPLNSFAAIGPRAQTLIGDQRPLDVYAPFRALVAAGGSIVLMGVGLERMTFIHYAEQQAERNLFRRWALDRDRQPMQAETGGCSDGFEQLAPALAPLKRELVVGQSLWQVFPARAALDALVQAIRENPSITHCVRADCERCNDAVQGGPLLTGTEAR